MSEADRLLHNIFDAVLAIERQDLERLMAFGADAVECEHGGDSEPNENLPVSQYWLWEPADMFVSVACS